MICMIAAVDENNGIGANNRLLCHLSEDLKRFKRITMGHPVVMGRRTYESLPVKPLPGRRNIVLSRSQALSFSECDVAASVEEALQLCEGAEKLFVIGGAQLYRQMMPLAQTLHITRIHQAFDADAWFPEIDAGQWRLLTSERNAPDEKNPFAFSFEEYARI